MMRQIYPLLKYRNNINRLKSLSRTSQHASTNAAEEKEVASLKTEKVNLRKPTPQIWKRPPFLKNMFLGKCDIHLLTYPEILDNKQVFELEEWVQRINKIYKEKVNPAEIESKRKVPGDVMQELKDIGLFGRLVPEKYGGLGISLTQYTRLNEALSPEWSIGTCLSMHELVGIQALLLYGNDYQKQKYLPDLASGKKLVAVCSYEPGCGYDVTCSKTMLSLTDDGKDFLLKGQKAWITNADEADLYIVFAKEETFHKNVMDHADDITVAIVEKNSPGLKVTPYTDTTGLLGTNCGLVEFDDVLVPAGNILGEPMTGNTISNKLREWLRFGIGTLTFGALKTLFDNITEYTINSERFDRSLAEYELVQKKLGNIAMKLYAMESLSYFTAAIYDSSQNADLTLETAALKVYNTEGTLDCVKNMIEILGCLGLSKMHQLEKFYRDAHALALVDAHNDFARLQIGLTGLQYYGFKEGERIEMQRNPFFYPKEKFQSIVQLVRLSRNSFKYSDDVAGHLHPSLVLQGNNLEECIQRLKAAAETTLVNFGAVIKDVQFDPVRLGDLLINLYVRTAVLSRCSRSYCVGHKNSHNEYKLAEVFCDTLHLQYIDTFMDVIKGSPLAHMESQRNVGSHVVTCRGYFPEHPLKHNY